VPRGNRQRWPGYFPLLDWLSQSVKRVSVRIVETKLFGPRDATFRVTGGGKGLGKAMAVRFRAGGDIVIIVGRDANQLASTAAEIDERQIICDATDPRQVARMADELGADLDVVVNMAGGNTDFDQSGGQGAHLEHVMRAWQANLDANLLSAWTAGLSSKVGPKGLTANVIAPGYIAETDFFHGTLSDQRRTALIGATHNGRAGHPSDIAETTYFLASDGARHITGQTLHVNGGAHTTR
jgi:3-oxoacyl-[acyl-carrier protein] reductase